MYLNTVVSEKLTIFNVFILTTPQSGKESTIIPLHRWRTTARKHWLPKVIQAVCWPSRELNPGLQVPGQCPKHEAMLPLSLEGFQLSHWSGGACLLCYSPHPTDAFTPFRWSPGSVQSHSSNLLLTFWLFVLLIQKAGVYLSLIYMDNIKIHCYIRQEV